MNGKEKAKSVLGFLFFRSAFTQRNITSIGLVLMFFFAAWLAGLRIDAVPVIPRDVQTFGGVKNESLKTNRQQKNIDAAQSKKEPQSTPENLDDKKPVEENSDDPFADIERKLKSLKDRDKQ